MIANKRGPYSIPNKGTYHRFKPKRWCATTRAIHALENGKEIILPNSARNTALTTVQRVAEAYGFKRRYRVLNGKVPGKFKVLRVQ